MSITKEDLVKRYGMLPHPEGGFYAETFRSEVTVQTEKGSRAASTAIYFLMSPGNISRLHRIVSDEVWHFYLGHSITVVELDDATGGCKSTILGNNITNGEVVQYVVKGGTWFGSFPNIDSDDSNKDAFSFMGCTVSPGFDFAGFEMGSNEALRKAHPVAAEDGIIDKLTVGLP